MQKQSMTIKEAIQIAIDAEIKAFNLYHQTSANVADPVTRAMLLELAEEEKRHRQALENVLAKGDYQGLGQSVPPSPGIAQFLIATELAPEALLQDMLIFAIQQEEKAQAFYQGLKSELAGTGLEELFGRLAAEEQKHKVKLEDQYEQYFLQDN